jgi:hypothetical protein
MAATAPAGASKTVAAPVWVGLEGDGETALIAFVEDVEVREAVLDEVVVLDKMVVVAWVG